MVQYKVIHIAQYNIERSIQAQECHQVQETKLSKHVPMSKIPS